MTNSYPYPRDVRFATDLLDENFRLKMALYAIIERSNNDPLGTSKVNDMRRIAQEALK